MEIIVNRTNAIYENAKRFIENGEGYSEIKYSSKEMKEKFEEYCKEDDVYLHSVVEFAICFAKTAQYLMALTNRNINKLKKIIIVAMLDAGYKQEAMKHALNLLKDAWIYGKWLD